MAVLGWGMMTMGALVRATESGLGCPDWPTCHGSLVAGGHHAVIEEIHRWIGTVLVVGLCGLAVIVLRRHRGERRVTGPMLLVLVLLAVQVVMGGVTVILKNVSWTVVVHYGAAALLVASIALLAVRLVFPQSVRAPGDALTAWFAALSFGLLLAGSTVANTDSHTSCGRSFPLCNGSALPGLDHHVVINLIHRMWAGVVLVLAVAVLIHLRRHRREQPALSGAAAVVLGLFLLQAGLGALVVAVGENTAVEVLHSSVGSATWLALAALLALSRTLPAASPPGQTQPVETQRAATFAAG